MFIHSRVAAVVAAALSLHLDVLWCDGDADELTLIRIEQSFQTEQADPNQAATVYSIVCEM